MEEAEYAWELCDPIGSKPDFVCALPNLLEVPPPPPFFSRKRSFLGCLSRCSNGLKNFFCAFFIRFCNVKWLDTFLTVPCVSDYF